MNLKSSCRTQSRALKMCEMKGVLSDILSVNLCNVINQFLGHYQIGTMQQVE